MREASWRVLELRHYDVQLIGGMVLHDGRLAEMATGEGKTLAATLPTYLHALTGKGALVVTANEYLARRDAETVGQVRNEEITCCFEGPLLESLGVNSWPHCSFKQQNSCRE